MTIVIQHRFWDLKVEEDNFTVGLSFGGVPATLHVPFTAVTQFHDPAVEFALTFQANADGSSAATSMSKRENDVPEPPTAETAGRWLQRRERGLHAEEVTEAGHASVAKRSSSAGLPRR